MHPEAPAHGTKQCFGDLGLRSFCRFRCNEGYIMEGFDATVCRKFGDEYRWDNPAPTCIKEREKLKLYSILPCFFETLPTTVDLRPAS